MPKYMVTITLEVDTTTEIEEFEGRQIPVDVSLDEAIELAYQTVKEGNFTINAVNGISVEGMPIGCVTCEECLHDCVECDEGLDNDSERIAHLRAVHSAIVAVGIG
jgi:hypothetical protein